MENTSKTIINNITSSHFREENGYNHSGALSGINLIVKKGEETEECL